jgi:hypothetical protein
MLVRLGTHVEAHDPRETFAAETGLLIETDADSVRAPDAALSERISKPFDGEVDEAMSPLLP